MTAVSSSNLNASATTPGKGFMPWYSAESKLELRAVFALLALLLLLRFEVVLNLGTLVLGGVDLDAGLYLWLVRDASILSTPWFSSSGFYPYGRSLAWSDNFVLPTLIAQALQTLGVPLIAAYNLVLLGAAFLNGYCTYRLAFRLCGQYLPAFIAGTVCLAYSGLTAQLGHPQLQFLFWVTLAIGTTLKFIKTRVASFGLVLGLIETCCFLSSVYYALFLPLVIGAIFFVLVLLRPTLLRPSEFGSFLLFTLLGLLPLIPFLYPYFEIRNAFGARHLYEPLAFAATPSSYLSAPIYNLFYSWLAPLSHNEAQLFPGLLVFVLVWLGYRRLGHARRLRLAATIPILALISVLILALDKRCQLEEALALWILIGSFCYFIYRMGYFERRLRFHLITARALSAMFLFVALIFFALSLGPLGNPVLHEYVLGPQTLFHRYYPGGSAIRAISRMGIVCTLALSLLIPIVLTNLQTKRKWPTWLLALICTAIVLENLHLRYPLEPEIQPPSAFLKLAELGTKAAVAAVLPFTSETTSTGEVKSWSDFALHNVRALNWGTKIGLTVLNGYSGQRSKLMYSLPGDTKNFPDQHSLAVLGSFANLKYIIYLPKNPEEQARVLKLINRNLVDLTLLYAGADSLLIEFHPETRISKDVLLRIPPYGSDQLELELMAAFQPKTPNLTLEVYRLEQKQSLLFSSLTLPANGDYQTYSLQVPSAPDALRPRAFQFKTDPAVTVFLRKRSYR